MKICTQNIRETRLIVATALMETKSGGCQPIRLLSSYRSGAWVASSPAMGLDPSRNRAQVLRKYHADVQYIQA